MLFLEIIQCKTHLDFVGLPGCFFHLFDGVNQRFFLEKHHSTMLFYPKRVFVSFWRPFEGIRMDLVGGLISVSARHRTCRIRIPCQSTLPLGDMGIIPLTWEQPLPLL